MENKPRDTAGAFGQPSMYIEGDVLVVRTVGSTGGPQMQRMIDMAEQLFARHGYILLLVDAEQTTGMNAEARRVQAAHLKRFVRPSHSAVYNVSAVVRALSGFVQRGIELVTGKVYPVSFHKDEAEARAQLASARAVLQRGAVASGGG